MQVHEVIGFAIERSGKSRREVSKACGRSPSWASVAELAQHPQLDTLARIADVAGLDVVLVDRATGERVATVDVPRA